MATTTRPLYPKGAKLPPRALQRGPANELLNAGPELSTSLKAGAWAASGYKGYMGLQKDKDINISRYLLYGPGSASDDEDPDIPKYERRIRKRAR